MRRGKENVFVYVSWRSYDFSPMIPCTLITKSFSPHALKPTSQKFRDWQTLVKIVFHLSIVISTYREGLLDSFMKLGLSGF